MTPTVTETDLVHQYQAALAAEDAEAIIKTGDALDAYDAAERARWNAPGALGRYAAWYANRGVPVFPIRPDDKRPATQHGFKEATTDPEQVRVWWERFPAANIGMPTGHLWDVVDVDAPKGPWTLAKDPDLQHQLQELAVGEVLTPNGGWHWYMPVDPDARNGTGLHPGIDLRATGGYVLLPPSRLHGRHYRWTHVPSALREAVAE